MYQELTAELTSAEREEIFDRSARRVYHLQEPEPRTVTC
jgi:hypothetical protein